MKKNKKPQDETHWLPQGLVLVTEIRTCACGASHRSPSGNLMIEYESETSTRRRCYKPGSDDTSKLHRSKIEVHSNAQGCERCFVTDKGKRPPRNIPRNLHKPHAEEKKEKEKVTPIALEDL